MCTAIAYGSFAGRNLDIERSYKKSLIITPRSYTFAYRKEESVSRHLAFIGIGTVNEGYPLYFDAVNEHGLYIAGLNYVGNAKYHTPRLNTVNLAPYELIPYILSKCKSVEDVKGVLKSVNLVGIPFNNELPVSELHYFIADKSSSITVEPDESGLNVYDNPIGVLSNNPSFPLQMHNLNNYVGLSNEPLTNRLSDKLNFNRYSQGMGALGLPGDLSSQSRFIRAAFHKLNLVNSGTPCDIFHLLSSVEMPKGSLKLGERYEYTAYSAVADLTKKEYHFRLYDSLFVSSFGLHCIDLNSDNLSVFPLKEAPNAATLES